MRADLHTRVLLALDQVGPAGNLADVLADDEEGGFSSVFLQDVEDVGGLVVVPRAVVEGEGDHLVVAGFAAHAVALDREVGGLLLDYVGGDAGHAARAGGLYAVGARAGDLVEGAALGAVDPLGGDGLGGFGVVFGLVGARADLHGIAGVQGGVGGGVGPVDRGAEGVAAVGGNH